MNRTTRRDVACVSCVALFVMTTFAFPAARAESPEGIAAAKATLGSFLDAWNSGSAEAVGQSLNFPMVSHFGTTMVIANSVEDFPVDFDAMRANEGWT